MGIRTETDSLGPIEVPATAYYGAHTARALANYPIGDERMPPAIIHALGLIKRCAAQAHLQAGRLAPDVGGWIAAAAAEVAAGKLDDHFPLPVWQTGSGTATHMNANEVIAGRANELAGGPRGGRSPVHPNDHVNLGQSSNDVFPTALHLAITQRVVADLLPALDELTAALGGRRAAFRDIVKIGRTHLMDAVPLTLGQELSGWEHQIATARTQVAATLTGLHELTLGGTAVGTGLNAPPGFAAATIDRLAAATGQPWRPATNRFAAQGSHDAIVAVSGALRGLAVALVKIAGDVRLLASGPRCGIGELRLPALEPGSSIMPGKINPGQAEALHMVAALVIGNDAAVGLAGATGHLQLNANKPLLGHAVLQQVRLLADGCRSFARRGIAGLTADRTRIADHLDRSLMLVTALAPHIGYDRAAAAAETALAAERTLRDVVLAEGLLTAADYDRLVDPARMAGTGPDGDESEFRDRPRGDC